MARRPDPPDMAGVAFRRRLSDQGARTEVWDARFTAGELEGYRVALKVVRDPAVADRDRLAREDAVLARLAGSGVVRVHGARTDPEVRTPWLATELVAGRNLRDRAPVRSDDAYLDLAVRIAASVAEIHAQGVAHRDLKDTNVVVARRGGRVVLIDYGLAAVDAPAAGGTERGAALADLSGTAGWMAPGRLEPGLDHAAAVADDVFSLALVLLSARLGRHPLHEDPETAQARIDESHEWPDEAFRGLPDGVRRVLQPALDFDRGRRPPARDVLRGLQDLVADRRARRPDWWRTRRARIVAVVAALAVLAGAAVVVAARVDDPRCPVEEKKPSGNATLRFGTVLPESGPIARRQQIVAARLAAADVKAAGSVAGIQVDDLTQMYDEGDGTDVCGYVDQLIRSDTDVVIGPVTSTNVENTVDAVTGAGRVMISPSASAPGLTDQAHDGRLFRTVGSDVLQARTLSRLVAGDGNRRVAVLYRDDAYGNGLAPALEQSLPLEGAAVVLARSYDPAADPGDYAAGVAREVRDARPDAVVVIGFDEIAGLVKALLDAGIPATDLFGSEADMREKLPNLVLPKHPEVLAGMRGTTLLPPRSQSFDQLARRVPALFQGPLEEQVYAAETYDAVVVAALAAAEAGTDQGDLLAARIVDVTRGGVRCTGYQECLNLVRKGEDIDYDGVSGPLDLTDTGDPCRVSYATVQFRPDGMLEQIGRTRATDLCIDPG